MPKTLWKVLFSKGLKSFLIFIENNADKPVAKLTQHKMKAANPAKKKKKKK